MTAHPSTRWPAITLTAGEEEKTVSVAPHRSSDADRESAVTAPPMVLRRSHPLARYGACCL
ncbi:hypothetical protein FRAAL1535 [Frankia alni ACN14a]|uniref:Uncharacterized protein n=1 Tax=Frankia alni (strain DSM 45986 / CECT 9034 / ACN14a) TaxID=326424 RepID=Q0RQI3_FRAAA|nr:hypothetical protein FRAAL1535 [Frankia alni ACN14a]